MLRRTFVPALLGACFLAGPARAVTIPRPAGEVAIMLPNGRQELLSKYRGKVVILNFILST